ncbi:Fatty acid-binding protein, brain, partial [Stegodyphus mimosarum]
MDSIYGKYKLVSSDEHFDEFLKACGVNIVMRKAGLMSKPVVEIKKEGDEFILKTTTTFKNSEIKFKLDEEFEETRMDGSNCKTIITLEDGKLVQRQ